MEVLAEQPQQLEPFEVLLADIERRISSGEKFFVRQEMESESKDAQHSFDTKVPSVGSAPKNRMRTFFYLIDEVGKSDCIYRYRPLSDYYSDDYSEDTLRMPERTMAFNLVAIRTHYRYYICRPDDLGIDDTAILPDWAERFSETVQYYNEYLQNTAFPAFYHRLQPYDIKPNAATVFRARRAALNGEDIGKVCGLHGDLPGDAPSFNELKVMSFVCNDISPEDAASRELADESEIGHYRRYKSENAMIQKLMEDPNLVSAEERALWDAVASQPNDARTLTVTFYFHGHTENLQIKPEAIREVILNRVSFKPADIAPSSRSDFFAMGAAPWSNGEKSTLTYEHITKISYWDTVLYDKKATQPKEKESVADIESGPSDPDKENNAGEMTYKKQYLRSPLHHR